jgi:hypothetical protein
VAEDRSTDVTCFHELPVNNALDDRHPADAATSGFHSSSVFTSLHKNLGFYCQTVMLTPAAVVVHPTAAAIDAAIRAKFRHCAAESARQQVKTL